jgi:hypothetical protein
MFLEGGGWAWPAGYTTQLTAEKKTEIVRTMNMIGIKRPTFTKKGNL